MNPDDTRTQTPDPNAPQDRSVPAIPDRPANQQAAAELVRGQINSLYDRSSPATQVSNAQALIDVNPYERTHSAHPQPDADQWKQYHSAWQTYYQKYYEGYYTHQLQTTASVAQKPVKDEGYFANQVDLPETTPEDTISKDEALFDLRQKLLSRVQESAKKVRKSRHFVPIISAIVVVLLFAFLQYNRLIISNVVAYISPGNIDPQNIVIDPNADLTVTPEPRLIIPKINVDVPVQYDVGNDYASQMKAMETGVAHFAIPGANSHPGQIGNTAIAGHSSNDLLDKGDYKFIFAQLEKLVVGDTIYAHYNSKRYTYTITRMEVVQPNEVNKLIYPTDKPVMTLITCTPIGTALQRLLVTAEQVSPDPTTSDAAPTSDGTQTTSIPGNSPTFLERLFGSDGN